MSARSRLDRVDELVSEARGLGLEPDDPEYDAGFEQVARLLEALVEATVASSEATLEASGRGEAARPGEERTITRHHTEDGVIISAPSLFGYVAGQEAPPTRVQVILARRLMEGKFEAPQSPWDPQGAAALAQEIISREEREIADGLAGCG